MPNPLSRILVVLILGSVVLGPGAAAAQLGPPPRPHWPVDVGVAGANVLTGALTAALTAAIRGESVEEAFFGGAVGGAAVFLGKRLAVERFEGAGLVGRQVGSVGANMVANAGAGRGWLEEVWLPLGPLWVQASPSSDFSARLDVLTAGAAVWAVRRPELELDWRRSLDSGALLFRSPRHRLVSGRGSIGGFAIGGIIAMGPISHGFAETQAHESVHVIQYDYMVHAMTRPAERWALSRLLGWEVPVDLSVLGLAGHTGIINELVEAEAEALASR